MDECLPMSVDKPDPAADPNLRLGWVVVATDMTGEADTAGLLPPQVGSLQMYGVGLFCVSVVPA